MSRKTPFIQPLVIGLSSHKFPQARQVTGKEWVYWGDKNGYFEFLLDLYYKCTKHGAIVNGKTKYIAGAGWGDGGREPINTDGESIDAVTKKIVLDYEIYGGFALEVIWNAGGQAEFRHVDFSKIRTNKEETQYYYTKDWLTKSGNPTFDVRSNKDFEVYEPFDSEKKTDKQLIYYKCYSPGLDLYPIPEYKPALLYIELEYQIANYWFNRVKNGFMPSAILNFYMGQPSDDEMKKLEERIGGKFAGTDNAGQFIVNFAPNKDSSADIQQIAPPELGAYESLDLRVEQAIFSGHGVTSPMLFGIKTAGQLGGRNELIESNELFQNMYVSPKQVMFNEFFEKNVFPFLKGAKADMKLQKQEPIGLDIVGNERIFNMLTEDEKRILIGKDVIVKDKKSAEQERIISNIQSLSPLVANEVMKSLTTNEIRGLAGLPPMKGGDKIPSTQVEPTNEKEGKQKFSTDKEKKILAQLRKKGKKRKGSVVYSRPVTFEMSKDLKQSESELFMKFDKKVPPIISGGQVPVGKTPMPERKPDAVISVVYSYEWIEGFNDSNLDTSREFCIEMRAMSSEGTTWTRQDIETLDNEASSGATDVWESRGGWWNDGGVAVPHCRHQFMQHVISE